MQFKVVIALAFATLAAASALPAGTNPVNPGTKSGANQSANIAPPFPGKETITPKECSSGHLRCCKSHLPKIVIVLQ